MTSGPENAPPVAAAPAVNPTGLSDPLINMLIDGRYRVLSRMARGGMATVYVARDERLDRLVALKVMHPHLAESEQFTARFKREARSAAKISHPGVVPIYDQGVVEGQGYLVMELVDGPDLRTLLSQGLSFTLRDALNVTSQLLDGLSAAHRAGVIHRDLKPENVLTDEAGNLKLVDFGLARAASEVSVSTTGSILGTVAYLAPEVALAGTSDARTDIFALGVMLYEMLTGELPGGNDNPVKVALSRVNEDIPAPSAKVSWLPSEVDDLVGSLCARDPAERPSSAIDAATLLRKTTQAIPEETLSQELPKPHTEPTKATSLGLTVPISKVGRTTVLPIKSVLVQTSGAVTTPDGGTATRRSKTLLVLFTLLLLLAALGLGTWWWWQQYGPGSYLDVPDLSGKTVSQAEDELAVLGLASTISYDNSDDVPLDRIIRTDPPVGDKVHRQQEIEVVVSKGVLMLEVPQTQGMTPEEAETLLKSTGFKTVVLKDEWSETVAQGVVIGTDPTMGADLEHYSAVDVLVSQGRMPISVPDLIGMTKDESQSALTEVGLHPAFAEDYSEEVPEGQVASQLPTSGDTRYRGDSISVVISKGPPFVTVPDVYGKNAEEAQAILEEAGFQVEVNRLAGFFNSIGAQKPAAGESARKGSVIQITVV